MQAQPYKTGWPTTAAIRTSADKPYFPAGNLHRRVNIVIRARLLRVDLNTAHYTYYIVSKPRPKSLVVEQRG